MTMLFQLSTLLCFNLNSVLYTASTHQVLNPTNVTNEKFGCVYTQFHLRINLKPIWREGTQSWRKGDWRCWRQKKGSKSGEHKS